MRLWFLQSLFFDDENAKNNSDKTWTKNIYLIHAPIVLWWGKSYFEEKIRQHDESTYCTNAHAYNIFINVQQIFITLRNIFAKLRARNSLDINNRDKYRAVERNFRWRWCVLWLVAIRDLSRKNKSLLRLVNCFQRIKRMWYEHSRSEV